MDILTGSKMEKKLFKLLKALSEKPGTYSFIDEKKIKIHKASNFEKANFTMSLENYALATKMNYMYLL